MFAAYVICSICVYLLPAIASAGTADSSAATSSALSFTAAAPTFSSRAETLLVPGIGITSGAFASSQAMASCPGVQPLAAAIFSRASTSFKFCKQDQTHALGQHYSEPLVEPWQCG